MKLKLPKDSGKHPAQIRSPKQEGQAAERLGGEGVKGSGCGWDRGDVRVRGVVRLECKTTSKKSFRVTREMISKIEGAVTGTEEVPAIEVELLGSGGEPDLSIIVIPTYAFDILCSLKN